MLRGCLSSRITLQSRELMLHEEHTKAGKSRTEKCTKAGTTMTWWNFSTAHVFPEFKRFPYFPIHEELWPQVIGNVELDIEREVSMRYCPPRDYKCIDSGDKLEYG